MKKLLCIALIGVLTGGIIFLSNGINAMAKKTKNVEQLRYKNIDEESDVYDESKKESELEDDDFGRIKPKSKNFDWVNTGYNEVMSYVDEDGDEIYATLYPVYINKQTKFVYMKQKEVLEPILGEDGVVMTLDEYRESRGIQD